MWANEEIQKHCPTAGICEIMDGIYALGPLDVIIPMDRLLQRSAGILQPTKCRVFHRDPSPLQELFSPNPQFQDFHKIACKPDVNPTTVRWGGGLGFLCAGMPTGDDNFISAHLQSKTDRTVATISSITSWLQSFSAQYPQVIGRFCFVPLLHCEAQILPKGVMEPFPSKLDAALNKVFLAATSVDPKCDPITEKRTELPLRSFGCGRQSQKSVFPMH